MEQFLNNQQIPLVQVIDPNTGQQYYVPAATVYNDRNGPNPTILKSVVVDQAISASYFSGSISNALYAATASYLDKPVVSASYASTSSYLNETSIITLHPQSPLPSNVPTGSFAVSSSNPPIPYFWDGSIWRALYVIP
jgi:hypothetical protein